MCIDGDGWQGAEISISTCDGTEVLAATTLSCAYEDYFCVDDFGEQDVVVTVTDDSWSSEVEWELFDSNGLSLIQGNDCEYASTADDAESTCPVYDSTTFSCSEPSSQPSRVPTMIPSVVPVPKPTLAPTRVPTSQPSSQVKGRHVDL